MGEQDGNSMTCWEAITIIRLGDSDGMDQRDDRVSGD